MDNKSIIFKQTVHKSCGDIIIIYTNDLHKLGNMK